MPFVILLILMIPVVELVVLIQVGTQLGALNTIGLTVLTAVVGLSLVRNQGLQVLQNARNDLSSGQVNTPVVLEGALLAVAGIMLLFPGFMTDTLGALFLVSPLRRAMAARLLSSQNLHVFRSGGFQGGGFDAHSDGFTQQDPFQSPPRGDDVIDGEYEEVDEARKALDDDRKKFD